MLVYAYKRRFFALFLLSLIVARYFMLRYQGKILAILAVKNSAS